MLEVESNIYKISKVDRFVFSSGPLKFCPSPDYVSKDMLVPQSQTQVLQFLVRFVVPIVCMDTSKNNMQF